MRLITIDFDGTLTAEELRDKIKQIIAENKGNGDFKIGIVTARSIFDDFDEKRHKYPDSQFVFDIEAFLIEHEIELDFISTTYSLHILDKNANSHLPTRERIKTAIQVAQAIPVFGDKASDYLAYRRDNDNQAAIKQIKEDYDRYRGGYTSQPAYRNLNEKMQRQGVLDHGNEKGLESDLFKIANKQKKFGSTKIPQITQLIKHYKEVTHVLHLEDSDLHGPAIEKLAKFGVARIEVMWKMAWSQEFANEAYVIMKKFISDCRAQVQISSVPSISSNVQDPAPSIAVSSGLFVQASQNIPQADNKKEKVIKALIDLGVLKGASEKSVNEVAFNAFLAKRAEAIHYILKADRSKATTKATTKATYNFSREGVFSYYEGSEYSADVTPQQFKTSLYLLSISGGRNITDHAGVPQVDYDKPLPNPMNVKSCPLQNITVATGQSFCSSGDYFRAPYIELQSIQKASILHAYGYEFENFTPTMIINNECPFIAQNKAEDDSYAVLPVNLLKDNVAKEFNFSTSLEASKKLYLNIKEYKNFIKETLLRQMRAVVHAHHQAGIIEPIQMNLTLPGMGFFAMLGASFSIKSVIADIAADGYEEAIIEFAAYQQTKKEMPQIVAMRLTCGLEKEAVEKIVKNVIKKALAAPLADPSADIIVTATTKFVEVLDVNTNVSQVVCVNGDARTYFGNEQNNRNSQEPGVAANAIGSRYNLAPVIFPFALLHPARLYSHQEVSNNIHRDLDIDVMHKLQLNLEDLQVEFLNTYLSRMSAFDQNDYRKAYEEYLFHAKQATQPLVFGKVKECMALAVNQHIQPTSKEAYAFIRQLFDNYSKKKSGHVIITGIVGLFTTHSQSHHCADVARILNKENYRSFDQNSLNDFIKELAEIPAFKTLNLNGELFAILTVANKLTDINLDFGSLIPSLAIRR